MCIPEIVFKILGVAMPRRAKFYGYQLRKVAEDAVYSGEKLRATGVALKWNMRNSLKK